MLYRPKCEQDISLLISLWYVPLSTIGSFLASPNLWLGSIGLETGILFYFLISDNKSIAQLLLKHEDLLFIIFNAVSAVLHYVHALRKTYL